MSLTQRGRARAFGLLEILLVFAVILGAGAIVFSVYQSAQASAQASRAVDQVNLIVGNTRALFPTHDFSGLNGYTNYRATRIFPADMFPTPTTQVPVNVFGGATYVGATSDNLGFIVDYNLIGDPEVCFKFMNGLATLTHGNVLMGGGYNYVIQNGKVNTSVAISSCQTANTSGLDLTLAFPNG